MNYQLFVEVVEFKSVRFLLPIFSFQMERLLLFEICTLAICKMFVYKQYILMVRLPVVPSVQSQHIPLLANFCMRWLWNSVSTTTIKTRTFSSSFLNPKWNVKSSIWYFLYLSVTGVLGASFRASCLYFPLTESRKFY